jgi:uncharacterized RDD family membrane protein YckC
MMQDHQLTIRTPEGVTFNLVLAGPISRSLAWLVDAVAIAAAAMGLFSVLNALGKLNADISSAIFLVAMFVVNLGYAMVLEWFWNGQTLGKRLLGLRVMDVRGLRLQPYQIIIRNLLRAVDSLPAAYLLGGLTSLFNRYAQRLGDLAANTIVIRERRVVEPDLDVILEKEHYNSLRDYPHLAARLRQQAAPEEAELALQALMRRDALTPEARVALFEELAAHLRQKVTFPREALEGVSDEQYVRNVVDVLFKAV